jgi:hypothetical protein
MSEFESLDRCAAYVAARAALEAIHRAVPSWPDDVADQAKRAAIKTLMTTAESLGHAYGSPARRRCVRAALVTAIDLAAACDVAKALGISDHDVDEAQRTSGRSIAMLGLLLHSSASPFAEEDRGLVDTRS